MTSEKNISLLLRIIGFVWVLAVAGSLAWNWIQTDKVLMRLAESEASIAFNRDVVYRRWAGNHGGVYVPPTDQTPPNPYLSHLPDRDVVTEGGKKLTLINPAYMTRQVHELGQKQYSLRGHITSLNPLRPENAPDEWEAGTLRAFKNGLREEVISVQTIDGQPYLRLMRPFVTEESCLKCHRHQGYQVGDIRGGISISKPLTKYFAARKKHKLSMGLAHGLIGFLGLAGLWAGGRNIRQSARQASADRDQFRALFVGSPVSIIIHDPDSGEILDANPRACASYGVSSVKELQNDICWLEPPYSFTDAMDLVKRTARKGPQQFEWLSRTVDGQLFWEHVNLSPISINSRTKIMAVSTDITERVQAEKEREKLQSQLTQAQKMESVGRLAGGVAHDYNNMLGVILGYTELALSSVNPDDPIYADLSEIHGAARRSADITRQLLAFARRQAIDPRIIDLNHTVEKMLKMLRRLVGEDIELTWHPGPALWPVNMDPAQIDQILANLLVNSRDAIGGVGSITIETDNVQIEEADCVDHTGLVPGDYVLLAVSDDGRGMDKETRERLFEPFFTTKAAGEGTGLGLATIYGIVKQNEGFIYASSKPDQGATFRIYLPRQAEAAAETKSRPPAEPPRGHGETVLIVEDEASILKLAGRVLRELDYTVLEAYGPTRALELVHEHSGQIDLLITDVVMPEMNGRELAEKTQNLYPDLEVLYMSGYTADVIASRGILESGVHFIQKPFTNHSLAEKVRRTLDEKEQLNSHD